MSSFVRTIERTASKQLDDDGNPVIKSKRSHYARRGSKLGYRNPKDPCRVPGAKKRPKPWRAAHKVDRAALKPAAPRTMPQPLAPKPDKQVQREAHAFRMLQKARRRDQDRLAIAHRSGDLAYAARNAMRQHKGKR